MFCMGSPPPNHVRAETAYVIEQAPCFHNPVPPQCLCQLNAGLRAAIHNYLVVSTQDGPYVSWSWVKRGASRFLSTRRTWLNGRQKEYLTMLHSKPPNEEVERLRCF